MFVVPSLVEAQKRAYCDAWFRHQLPQIVQAALVGDLPQPQSHLSGWVIEYRKNYSVFSPTKTNTVLCTEPRCLHFQTYERAGIQDHVYRCMNLNCKHKFLYFHVDKHKCTPSDEGALKTTWSMLEAKKDIVISPSTYQSMITDDEPFIIPEKGRLDLSGL
jgi:hypothetical protein